MTTCRAVEIGPSASRKNETDERLRMDLFPRNLLFIQVLTLGETPYQRICSSGLPTCIITSLDKKLCNSILLEKEKWQRKVDALDTAIQIYIEKG